MLRSAVPAKARSFLARDQSLRGTLSHLHRGQDKVAFGLRSGTRRGCVRTREHTRAQGATSRVPLSCGAISVPLASVSGRCMVLTITHSQDLPKPGVEKASSKGKARAELRPARRQSRLPHSRSLLLPAREC